MKLLAMEIQNFKGIRSLSLAPEGKDLKVYGDNGTGKTSIADAYTWMLTGKDSRGQAKFDIYPIDSPEDAVVSVTGRFLSRGEEAFTLQRSYRKVYSRKNGEASRELKGNTTDYAINGVPKPQKEYSSFISEKFGEETQLILMTDPDYFPGRMDARERRGLLLEIFAPHYGDQEVIANHKELDPLAGYIGAMTTVEELSLQKKARRKKINEELEGIPVRIDELNRSRPEIPEEESTESLSSLAMERQKLNNRLIEIQSGTKLAAIKARISELQTEQAKAEAEYIRQKFSGNQEIENCLHRMRKARLAIEMEISRAKMDLEDKRSLVSRLEPEIVSLRENWMREHDTVFDTSQENCRYCGQRLPLERIRDMREEFHQCKAEALERIQSQGKEKSALCADLKERMLEAEKSLQEKENERDRMEEEINRIAHTVIQPPPFSATEEARSYQERILQLEKEAEGIRKGQEASASELKERLREMDEKLDEPSRREASLQQNSKIDKRIRELMQEEKRLGNELAKTEKLLQLMEKFNLLQSEDIEGKVNSAFSIVRWQLFEHQINGGVKAICEATVDGVKYGSTLNTAAKLNAGLDIINTLSSKLGREPLPIIIDNAESITSYFPVEAQMIRLYVSEQDKQLRMEVQSNE